MDQTQLINKLGNKPIAYFCAEFALDDSLPIFSGGLGILAGDCLRQAADQKVPLVGIGLLYKQGYFKQIITPGGMQDELPAYSSVESGQLRRLQNADTSPIKIKIRLGEREVYIQMWEYAHNGVRVILLDTDVDENIDLDRRLTLTLYPSDSEWRIQQEIILGVGGVRALKTIGLDPSVYHMNEGHSAFAVLEVAHQCMKANNTQFAQAFEYACSRMVFTNHTLIPSGNDVFHKDQVERLLGSYTAHLGLNNEQVIEMGKIPDLPDFFSMTHLAMSASKIASAVSRSHAQFAKTAWPDFNLLPITNGVHAGTWQDPRFKDIGGKVARGFEVSDGTIWRAHQDLKERLCEYVVSATGRELNPDVLTITWARRVAAYKQPLILFSDITRLQNLINNSKNPIQILIAGKAHPGDNLAKTYITQILGFIKDHRLENSVIFLPNYSMNMAKLLVSGSDVWLNTPEKGKEACGTSGMKAALNGVVQAAISDGWTDEIDLHDIGYSINPIDSPTSLYNILESQVVPCYYKRIQNSGIPEEWVSMMRKTIMAVEKRFTADRMLNEYIEKLYIPVIE